MEIRLYFYMSHAFFTLSQPVHRSFSRYNQHTKACLGSSANRTLGGGFR
jgi:hypothetical protein